MQYRRMLIARWNSEGGQAIVEMTLLLPFFLLLLMGVIDFSRVFYTALTITHAARAGAQYGAQSNGKSQDDAGMAAAARTAAQDVDSLSVTATHYCMCTPDGVTLTPMATCTSACINTRQIYVQVTTSKTFQTLWNYPGVPHTITLSRTAILRAQ